MTEPILEVTDLVTTHAPRGLFRRGSPVRAVDGVSFTVKAGEVLAIVGESGCGKTTTAHSVLRMLQPSSGSIVFQGRDIAHSDERALRSVRRQAQMIFQDPYESLDPRFTVRATMLEPLQVHEPRLSSGEKSQRIERALETVGLTPVEVFLERYAHELSGGQRQRVAIAASLVIGPRLLIADEPVSMLDVSVRAGILELLQSLCTQGMGVVMITHDLSTVAHFADRVAVMYLGRIVEEGPVRDVLRDPQHPYTQALLSVVPVRDPLARRAPVILSGETPNAARVPSGCRFHPRCPLAVEACRTIDPGLRAVHGEGHRAACILLGDHTTNSPVEVHA